MNSNWEEKRLGELCSHVSRGITPKYSDEGISVVNQKCIRDNKVDISLCRFTDANHKIPPNKYVQYGDILINSTGTGTLGRTAIFRNNTEKISIDGHVTVMKVVRGVNSFYVGYFLHQNERTLENFGRGSTNQMELSAKDIKTIKIKLPPLQIQQRIVDILSAYDDLIENNNRRIELLEKAAQDLYKEWFVRFRFPGYETTKFEKGIPKEWEVKRLADFGRVETGKTPPTNDVENYGDEIMFVKTPDMHGEAYVVQTGEYISQKGHATQPKKLLPENSIMVSCIGTGGVVAINATQAHTNQQINSIILKDMKYLEWLYFTCLSLKPTIELFGGTGVTMTNLSKGKFEKIKVISPSEDLVYRYNDKTCEMIKSIRNLMLQNSNLVKQRNRLLPRLMSGKLEV